MVDRNLKSDHPGGKFIVVASATSRHTSGWAAQAMYDLTQVLVDRICYHKVATNTSMRYTHRVTATPQRT